MLKSTQYTFRGFHILSDAISHYKPLDAICQFEYKGYQISISTAGLSRGACQSEVFIFGGEDRTTEIKRVHTVQEAIEYVDGLNKEGE